MYLIYSTKLPFFKHNPRQQWCIYFIFVKVFLKNPSLCKSSLSLHNRSLPHCSETGDLQCFSSPNNGQSDGKRRGLKGQCFRTASNPCVRRTPCVAESSCWNYHTSRQLCSFLPANTSRPTQSSQRAAVGCCVDCFTPRQTTLSATLELIWLSEQCGVFTAFQLLF
jgi:hypothetical protein